MKESERSPNLYTSHTCHDGCPIAPLEHSGRTPDVQYAGVEDLTNLSFVNHEMKETIAAHKNAIIRDMSQKHYTRLQKIVLGLDSTGHDFLTAFVKFNNHFPMTDSELKRKGEVINFFVRWYYAENQGRKIFGRDHAYRDARVCCIKLLQLLKALEKPTTASNAAK